MFSENRFLSCRSVQAPCPTPVMPSLGGPVMWVRLDSEQPPQRPPFAPRSRPVMTAVGGSDLPGETSRGLCHAEEHARCVPAASKSTDLLRLEPGRLTSMSLTLCKYKTPTGSHQGQVRGRGREERRAGSPSFLSSGTLTAQALGLEASLPVCRGAPLCTRR